jgi:hypothetical protein
MKAKYDIYIRKDLQEDLDKEPNMSGLINDLLAEHFKKVAKQISDFHTVGIRSKHKVVTADKGMASVVTPDPGDVKVFKKRIEKVSAGFCKNGHPIPEGYFKCLGKGCKYSK